MLQLWILHQFSLYHHCLDIVYGVDILHGVFNNFTGLNKQECMW